MDNLVGYAVFSAVNALIITAASIVALYLLRRYLSLTVVLMLPSMLAIIWGVLTVRNPLDWLELANVIMPPLLVAPLFAWLFFRKRLTQTSGRGTSPN